MQTALNDIICRVLSDMKALNVVNLDVTELTPVTDRMIIATGTSARHVKAMANNILDAAHAEGYRALGAEGMDEGEWVCVDLGHIVVHLMQPRVRDYYYLEGLWDKTRASISA